MESAPTLLYIIIINKKIASLLMGMRWLGRPDLASRALKTVHWTVFAPRDADAGHGLFKSGLSFSSTVYHNKKDATPYKVASFGWAGRI